MRTLRESINGMQRLLALVLAALVLAGCAVPNQNPNAPRLISPQEARLIPGRHLVAVNEARRALGLADVTLDARLEAAADVHARDMSRQRRVWHFGSDGSSPLDRVLRQDFDGALIGENVAETFENDVEVTEAWLRQANSRSMILDPDARSIGIGWKQDFDGRFWWVQLVGG